MGLRVGECFSWCGVVGLVVSSRRGVERRRAMDRRISSHGVGEDGSEERQSRE